MKKILLILILIVSTISYGQITYGAKGGLNITNLKDIHGDSGSRYGFHIGGFATIPLGTSNQFYFQPEVLYSQQGEKNTGENFDEVYQLDYINVPLLFKPYFSEQDTEFYGIIGPQVGFLVMDNVKNEAFIGYENDEYNSLDIGALLGIGFSYLRTWEFEVRYLYGFTDAVKYSDVNDAKNRTSNLHFSIGYRF